MNDLSSSQSIDLIRDGQLNVFFNIFNSNLRNIANEVHQNRESFETAIKKTQDLYGDNIKYLIGILNERNKEIIESKEAMYQKRFENFKETLNKQITVKEQQINELINKNNEKDRLIEELYKQIQSQTEKLKLTETYIKPKVIKIKKVKELQQKFIKFTNITESNYREQLQLRKEALILLNINSRHKLIEHISNKKFYRSNMNPIHVVDKEICDEICRKHDHSVKLLELYEKIKN